MNIVVSPESFVTLSLLPGKAEEAIRMVMSILRQNEGIFPGAKMDVAIPDIAPTTVKNGVANGRGVSYKVIVTLDGKDGAVLIQWFVEKGINVAWIFNIQHPVDFEVVD